MFIYGPPGKQFVKVYKLFTVVSVKYGLRASNYHIWIIRSLLDLFTSLVIFTPCNISAQTSFQIWTIHSFEHGKDEKDALENPLLWWKLGFYLVSTTNNLAQAHQHEFPTIVCMWGFKTLILLFLNLFLIFHVYKLFINCLYYLFTVSVYLQVCCKHKLNSWSLTHQGFDNINSGDTAGYTRFLTLYGNKSRITCCTCAQKKYPWSRIFPACTLERNLSNK
jgi:hypothetical protein